MPKKIKDIKKDENKNELVKVKATPTPATPSAEDVRQRVQTKAEQMKAQLESQPKVSILIPLEKGEKKGSVQPFCLNGYRFNVPKGQMTQVPEQVANIISERFNVELEVRSQSIEQRDKETKSALDVL